jgi:glyoxylase-like metal-dependent hydrolase (beta-lactamase superfamily II)/8-oxo-dGTP pyrophosphatase MutT (NUDIX family)
MTRPHHRLHVPTAVAPAQNAVSLIWGREQSGQLQVLMTQRSSLARFAPGAYVFAGGKIDEADQDYAKSYLLHSQAKPAQRKDPGHASTSPYHVRPEQTLEHLTQAAAALRESFEEVGLLLVRDAQGSKVSGSQVWGPQGLLQHQSLYPQLRARDWHLALDALYVMCHWVTDRDLPIRFDVPFLWAQSALDQTPQVTGGEQVNAVWLEPQDALKRYQAKTLHMVYPTLKTLQRLEGFADCQSVLDACRGNQAWFSSTPRGGFVSGQETRHMEQEGPYGELALVCPEGQLKHSLDWQSDAPVALLKNLHRLTAPNPGLMTGPGTNTFIVGTRASGFIVIDPGPALAQHLERICQFTQGDIRAIICTHSHADHSPGAKPLQAMCEVAPTIMGLKSQETAKPSHHFVPEHELSMHERIRLVDGMSGAHGLQVSLDAGAANSAEAATSHTLRVIHTPGHAANHLCLVFEEEGLLFSGDHILNGSTTIVDPPDGCMTAYLNSLDTLLAVCDSDAIEFIAPAHGHVMGNYQGTPHGPKQIITHLKNHRLKREAKIKAVMLARPLDSLSEWVKSAYDDVPERLWPAAERSLTAHVKRLLELGLDMVPTPEVLKALE